uniref:Phospholipase A2-like domain-containing protein n=1 Tax=Timema bartmani TaxID=61472 RepID=A0A7R9F9M3_9NEOP|nr:unnamed protein product [Timema bartmani]
MMLESAPSSLHLWFDMDLVYRNFCWVKRSVWENILDRYYLNIKNVNSIAILIEYINLVIVKHKNRTGDFAIEYPVGVIVVQEPITETTGLLGGESVATTGGSVLGTGLTSTQLVFGGTTLVGAGVAGFLAHKLSSGATLAGHSYIGPGNPLDNGEPVDKDDQIAKEHDQAYETAKSSKNIFDTDQRAIDAFAEDYKQHDSESKSSQGSAQSSPGSVPRTSGRDITYPEEANPRQVGSPIQEPEEIYPEGYLPPTPGKNIPELNREESISSSGMASDGDVHMDIAGTSGSGKRANEGSPSGNAEKRVKAAPSTKNLPGSAKSQSLEASKVISAPIAGSGDNIVAHTVYYLTTALAQILVHKPILYMNKSEFDLLPQGSEILEVKVSIVQRNALSFATNASTTNLATLDQNKIGVYAIGLNKTGYGMDRK